MVKIDQQELEALADYLSDKEEDILEKWEEEIKKSGVESTDLLSISQDAFQDNIPIFLNHFYNSIRDHETSSKIIGRKHGAQRWEYGLELKETMQEWNILQLVLMDYIYTFQDECSLSIPSLRKVQGHLAEHINDSILYSVKEYNELEQKEAEAQLRDIKQALEDPDESNEITRSHNLRSTSHDLKGIMKNLQMGFFLLEDENLDKDAAELIDQMSIAADSLEQLLNDLLDLFRLETQREELEVSEVNAAKVLRELCESMQPMAKSAELELRCSGPESLEVHSDRKKIQRIARNLILNGLKYTTEGHVQVKWEVQSDSQWVMEISDTGPGLSATHAKSLTTNADSSETVEYHSSSSSDGEDKPPEVQNHGEGIGLLIVRHLCKLLNANIKIDTEPGSGTTFKIVMPVDVTSE